MVARARTDKGVRIQPGLSREVGEGRGLNTMRWCARGCEVPGVCGVWGACVGSQGYFLT